MILSLVGVTAATTIVLDHRVDWEREDLFHLPLDMFPSFCCYNLSRQTSRSTPPSLTRMSWT